MASKYWTNEEEKKFKKVIDERNLTGDKRRKIFVIYVKR